MSGNKSAKIEFNVVTRSRSRQETRSPPPTTGGDDSNGFEQLGQLEELEPGSGSSTQSDLGSESILDLEESGQTCEDEMAEARAPIITPSKFTGHPSGDNVEEYLTKFERAARANGWNEARKVVLIPCYLEGAALKWFENLEQSVEGDMTWAQVKAGMTEAFQTIAWDEQLEYRLRMRMQGEDEPIESYLQDVTNLCVKVDPDMSERCKIKHVLRGLKPSLLEKVMVMENNTLERLRENIRKVQTARFMAGQRVDHLLGEVSTTTAGVTATTSRPIVQETTSRIENQLENLATEFSKLNMRLLEQSQSKDRSGGNDSGARGFQRHRGRGLPPRRGGGRTADGRVICYKCNRVGHYAVNCRPNSQNQGNEAEGR